MARLAVRLENASPFVLSPSGSGAYVPPWTLDQLRGAARLADDLGYDSMWSPEGLTRDAFTLLTALSLATRNIKPASGVLSIFARTPTTTAMSAASLDIISGGRFILGLGVSHEPMTVNGHGVPFDKPITRMRETVDIVRAILEQSKASYDGRVYRIRDVGLGFPPERAELPVYIAALRPQMVELAGEIATGVLLNFASPGYMRKAVGLVAEGARKAGRDPRSVDVACFIRVAITDDFDSIRPALQRYLSGRITLPFYRYYFEELGFEEECRAILAGFEKQDPLAAAAGVSDRLIHELTIAGPAEHCRERLEELRSLGLQLPVIGPAPIGDPMVSYVDTLKALAP